MKIKSKWILKESVKIIEAAYKKWGKSLGIAFTGRKDSSVMMHLVICTLKEIPEVMFIDHGLHFQESYETLEKLEKKWKLKVHRVADKNLLAKLEKEEDPDRKREILAQLKIKSIKNTMRKYKWKALMSAIRWDENPARGGENYFSKRKGHWRVHPILHWKEGDIWKYIKEKKIPYNPLYDKGYRSIGAEPFTRRARGEERQGRDKAKEEIMDRLRGLGYF
jgi:phosphoadenosine phosphosulfate reductase